MCKVVHIYTAESKALKNEVPNKEAAQELMVIIHKNTYFSSLFSGLPPTTLRPHNPVKFCADLKQVQSNEQQSLNTPSCLICIYFQMALKETLTMSDLSCIVPQSASLVHPTGFNQNPYLQTIIAEVSLVEHHNQQNYFTITDNIVPFISVKTNKYIYTFTVCIFYSTLSYFITHPNRV